MKIINRIALAGLLALPGTAAAHGEDDPWVGYFALDRVEWRAVEGDDPLLVDIETWIGTDLHKFVFTAETEFVDNELEEAELHFHYQRPLAAFWDMYAGWRHDAEPSPERDWLVIGAAGTAPWYIDTDVALYFGEGGQTALALTFEHEYKLTQQWVVVPELELDFFGKDDDETGTGSGLAEMEFGLRVAYEATPNFAPYVGVVWSKLFGETRDIADDEGEDTSDVTGVAGFGLWF